MRVSRVVLMFAVFCLSAQFVSAATISYSTVTAA